MKGQVVGVRSTNFTAKETGEVISGKTVFVLYEDEKVEGFAADRIFLKESLLAHYQPVLKDIVDIQYNRYGKVESIAKIGAA